MMNASTPSQESKRSFPEAREFLLEVLTGPDYPVKHLIEQARNKGHITKGKRGRGGGVVTSQDMAMLLVGTLAGETPQTSVESAGRSRCAMGGDGPQELGHPVVYRHP